MDTKDQLGLNELLKWSIENATRSEDPTTGPTPGLEPLDPKWVDVILGKPDAVRMRDAMAVVADAERDVAERLASFDDLELLVEHIDNANDLKACKLWAPLIAQQRDAHSEIRAFAAWVIGTAVQNNPHATKDWQEAGGLEALKERIEVETEPSVVAKLVGVVSGLVSHSPSIYLPLFHSSGTLAHLAAHLHFRPRHMAAKRLLHMLANALDTVPSLAALFSAPGWLERAVDVHVRCTNEGPDYLEVALRFVVAVARHNPQGASVLKHSTWQELRDVIEQQQHEDPDALDTEVVQAALEFANAAAK